MLQRQNGHVFCPLSEPPSKELSLQKRGAMRKLLCNFANTRPRLATRPAILPYTLETQASLPSNQNFTVGQEQQGQQNEIIAVTFKQSVNKGYRVMAPHTQNLTLVVFFFVLGVFFLFVFAMLRTDARVSPLIGKRTPIRAHFQRSGALLSNL